MREIQQTRIAVFSDIHIGVNMNNMFWHKVAIEYGEWLVRELKSKGISEIIFCGDFFDSRNEIEQSSLNTGTDFLSLFKDFKIWLIVGNHDSYYKEKSTVNSIVPFRYWPNISVIDKVQKIKTKSEKTLVLVPWGTQPKDIPHGNIIFGHFELNGFKLNSHEVCSYGTDVNDVLEKSSLVVSGHFHLRDEKKYSKGTVLYVGSAYELNFSDAESKKGYYIINTNDNTYEFIENNITPKHYNITLSDLIQEENLKEYNKVQNSLVKLIVDRNICPEDMDFLIKQFRKLNPTNLIIDYKITFSPLNVNKGPNAFNGISVEQSIQDFIELLEINNKSEVFKYVSDLYLKHK